ncbi:MAG TPA: ABC transporter substrate-binding protein [Casimicrobiaceae bacterium]|nr:ABC transporter substrate-binding protein [Casimicrobiaceae bacterium]
MKQRTWACIAAALALAWSTAYAQVKIGVIASTTGPTAVVGIPQKNTVALLPKKIGDYTVEYIVLDDASDPTQTVIDAKKLLGENIDALIGPSGSPNAVGIIGFMAESGTPMLAPVGTTAVVLPMDDKKRWVFKTTQNDALISDALVAHMVKNGVKTVGFIGFNDPYGDNWYSVFRAQAEKAGMKLVAAERYTRSDASVTGQVAKLMAAKPDAVLVGAAGGPTVLPETTLVDAGYKGRIYQTHGAAAPDFLRLGGAKVDGTILAASLMLVLPEIPDSVPSKKVAQEYIAAYEKVYGNKPATFGANVYDAGLLLTRAIPEAAKKAKPGTTEFRAALRDALETTHELVGTQGVYNMTPADHSGFDERGRVLIGVKDGNWRLLK